ncbi:type I polyketide synthase [Kitasatospora sp. NPDC005856]|uniref:type I polyketide synthase n=1 Tax=Kitasatospora sp. NPDC005856 TaxID=3154566 RepID=UPI003407195C
MTTSTSQRLATLPPAKRGELAQRLGQTARTLAAEPIAVVGLGCRLPGGVTSPEGLWSLLAEGREAVGAGLTDRWAQAGLTGATAEPVLRRGGFLDDPTGFDNEFFGISPREAAAMDPQQRMLLEVAWETAEHAGIPARGLAGSRTGVYLGMYYNEYLQEGLADPASLDAYTITGGLHSVAAGRLSYVLGLKGPALSLDTACSSSLAAVHLACQSLRLRECDLAFAGGANLILRPELSLSLHRYGLLSPDGRCKTFDASADGIVRTEGCALVLLKRLSDALDDGDRVLAVVRGSAVNQDGRSNGLTAPSGSAQRELLAETAARSGTDPARIGLVETHGTGTVLGDPIEVEAIASVYGAGTHGGCALGAAKTNLGHTEAAAGAVALMKAVLAVRHGVIPPNLHFERLNPKIDLAGTRLFVPTEATEWPVADGPRLAAASAFGMGGTNAHVIVEQAPDLPERAPVAGATGAPHVLLLSGATREAVREAAEQLADQLAAGRPEVRDMAHTLAHRRSAQAHRVAVVGADPAALADRLRRAARGEAAAGTARGEARPAGARGAVWVFSGHGSQWTGMGRELLADPVFAAVVDELAPVFRDEAGIDLRAELADADLESAPADRIQPLIHVLQVGLAQVLLAAGARPAAVLGHSLGEIAAAVVAGALDRRDAARLVLRRSRLLADLAGHGTMLAVELSAEEAAGRFAEHAVDVAILATGGSVVLSGEPQAVDAVLAQCERDGTPARRVASDVAFHGRQLAGPAEALARAVDDLAPGAPQVAVYGTVHEDARRRPAYDAGYWAANLRGTVRFADAVEAALTDGHRVFLEIAPHPVVTRSVARIAEEQGTADTTALATLRRGEPAAPALSLALAALHCVGAPVDLAHLVPGGRLTDLPTYPWQHRRHGPAVGPRPQDGERATPEEWVHELTWRAAPEAPAGPVAGARNWLLIDDGQWADDGRAATLSALLTADGGGCGQLTAERIAELDDEKLAVLLEDADRVVDLTALGHDGGVDTDPAGVHADTLRVLRLARVLAARSGTATGRPDPLLHVVTRLAQAVDGDTGTDAQPGGAALWGLGAALAVDYPRVWGGLVDLDVPAHPAPGDDDRERLAALAAELRGCDPGRTGHEPQVAHRRGERHVPRLTRARVPADTARLDPDGSHLLIGASGLLGPRIAERLVALGARHLVLASRRGPAPELAERLRAAGAEVVTVALDVSDAAAMTALFDRFGSELPPLHGVFNAALSGGYTETAGLTEPEVADMLRPKVDGTLLLHRLGLAQPVRHFVLFSSTTALLGSRGLAHYAAANRFQDTFVHARRAQGLPAQVVNWGAWGEWFTTSSYGDLMRDSGMRGLDDDLAVRFLDRLLADGAAQYVVAAADWPVLAAAYRSRAAIPLLDELAPVERASTSGEAGARIAAAPAARRRGLLRDHVRAVVAEVMGFADPREVPTDERFFQLGMDSLMSLRAQQRLADDLGCELPPAELFNHPTVDGLTDRLLARLAPPPTAPPAAVAAAASPVPTGDLTEDELVRRLTEKLRSL